MTQQQKDIITELLNGGSIVGSQAYGYRLRDGKMNPISKFDHRSFYRIKNLLRNTKAGFMIDKRKVRQLHGKSFAKRMYKSIKNQNSQ